MICPQPASCLPPIYFTYIQLHYIILIERDTKPQSGPPTTFLASLMTVLAVLYALGVPKRLGHSLYTEQ